MVGPAEQVPADPAGSALTHGGRSVTDGWSREPQREPQRYLSRAEERRLREAAERKGKGKGRFVVALAGLVVVALICGVGYIGAKKFLGDNSPADFASGEAGPEVVVVVQSGDTATQIGEQMAEKGVVASSAAFYNAAVGNSAMNSVQPGYYHVQSKLPAADAVAAIVDPNSRVGSVVISEGRQLHDTRDVTTGATKRGIYTLISQASCVPADGGVPKCVSVADLDAAGASPDLAGLGVPDWAAAQVAGVPDRKRQLEGLIAAGSWDFDPAGTPTEILRTLVSGSAAKYEATGIRTAGAAVGLSPYQVLITASMVERESLPSDFGKVARVIINRLAVPQRLEFDSTVNYALDATEVATTDADRARVTPWNTYAKDGLPATPISSPSITAVQAVEAAPPGDWLYFVTIDKQGTTLFTKSYDEHLQNIKKAQGSGILDSGR
ncbi:aminodeoxychorismate lyase [Rhodococcus spelaei]|uniref:Endolytic murein transglycosylase n=1 Tax=Rhodococcus spelaei TaxID=2546320 RepID=A0A541B257_9NOCA|nr:aminodeoxychorismate lyase [Rhodococcus spelaei]